MPQHSAGEPEDVAVPAISLRRLYYFAVLADELHFRRAAARLYLAQPALSQQVKILERELGVLLLDRGRGETRLTPAGELLKEEARRLLSEIQESVEKVHALQKGYTGKLRVAYTRSAAYLGPSEAVHKFREQHPEVMVRTMEGWTALNIAMLHSREIDVSFVRPPVYEWDISTVQLLEEELVVALYHSHRLSNHAAILPADLREEDVVLWPRELGPGYYDRIVGQIWGNSRPRIVVEEPDDVQILAEVAAARGIAIVELHRAIRICPPTVLLRPFAAPVPKTGLAVAWLDGHSTAMIEDFVSICRKVVPLKDFGRPNEFTEGLPSEAAPTKRRKSSSSG